MAMRDHLQIHHKFMVGVAAIIGIATTIGIGAGIFIGDTILHNNGKVLDNRTQLPQKHNTTALRQAPSAKTPVEPAKPTITPDVIIPPVAGGLVPIISRLETK